MCANACFALNNQYSIKILFNVVGELLLLRSSLVNNHWRKIMKKITLLAMGLTFAISINGMAEGYNTPATTDLNKAKLLSYVKSALAGKALPEEKSKEAETAKKMTSGLTEEQQSSLAASANQGSSLVSCDGLNYPSLWEFLGLCI